MSSTRFCLTILTVLFANGGMEAAEGRSQANRHAALEALCQRLDIGAGAVIADVGCGDGGDSMAFARVVGGQGTVLAQEIDPAKLKKVIENAQKRGLHQVVPVLGQSDDPRLPDRFANLIYMNRVFHHFARPQAMLERLWHDLKPGGFLAVVDQQKGPLTDWAPIDSREKQHHWTGETTVVRLAREAGFHFHNVLDQVWHEKQPFVLVFRKPNEPGKPSGDPDLPRPLDADHLAKSLPLARTDGAVVFCGLDQGRAALPKLKSALTNRFFDLIIDEWAVSREELPAGAPLADTEILRTEKGRVSLPLDLTVGGLIFVDSYHRLWEPVSALRGIKDRMTASGWVAIADRTGPEDEPRRLANHRRRIAPKQVIAEMREAGFRLQETLSAPTPDRFLLLFTPADS